MDLMFKKNIVSYISRFTDVTLSKNFTCYVITADTDMGQCLEFRYLAPVPQSFRSLVSSPFHTQKLLMAK